jgi:hypothetical protein
MVLENHLVKRVLFISHSHSGTDVGRLGRQKSQS